MDHEVVQHPVGPGRHADLLEVGLPYDDGAGGGGVAGAELMVHAGQRLLGNRRERETSEHRCPAGNRVARRAAATPRGYLTFGV